MQIALQIYRVHYLGSGKIRIFYKIKDPAGTGSISEFKILPEPDPKCLKFYIVSIKNKLINF